MKNVSGYKLLYCNCKEPSCFYLVFELFHIVFWKLVLLISAMTNVRHFYPHTHKCQFDVKHGSLSMDAAPNSHKEKNHFLLSLKYITALIKS